MKNWSSGGCREREEEGRVTGRHTLQNGIVRDTIWFIPYYMDCISTPASS
jgi:hypothetical protein